MKKLFKKKTIVIITFTFLLLIIFSGIWSYTEIKVVNPFAAVIGKMQIMCTDADYVVVQTQPHKIVFHKSGYSLEDYMESAGFTKTDQFGALFIFTKDDGLEQRIMDSGGGHFPRWRWISE